MSFGTCDFVRDDAPDAWTQIGGQRARATGIYALTFIG